MPRTADTLRIDDHNWHRRPLGRGARRLTEQEHDTSASIVIDEPAVDARRKANWARLMQKVYEVDPVPPEYSSALILLAFIWLSR